MTKFYFSLDKKGKLIRDKIEKNMIAQGHEVKSRQLSGNKLLQELFKKFPEEFKELEEASRAKDSDGEMEELADLLTLIEGYMHARGFDEKAIGYIKQAKIAKSGAFNEGLFVEWIDLNPDSETYDFWAKHYRDRPEGYIEEKEVK